MPTVTRKSPGNREQGRRQRQEQMEARLLEATERLMRDGTSFTELSVDRLATEAGISRASFYIYFEDKGHLLRRLAGQVFHDLASNGRRWWDVASRRNPDDVRAAISGIIASYRRHQPVLIALNEVSGYDPTTAHAYRELLGAVIEQVTQVIEEGQADGSIRSTLPAVTTASALTWMVERACQQNLPAQPREYDIELAATLVEIIWGALYLEPAK
ncbi:MULTISPECIES: TetR/AcrR family transcriptional regulator [Mycobacterium]|uniref:TetR family transcriptional regulator n=1 Tax=Mycobacterium kiyosense TaxID=2871094 RepID=A0A9P3Q1E4_9MYCO|nr:MULTISPECIES: TetR/AcrR family transcriptional regulator [Mycobacterium]BDB41597.1 TetR family transcriptional regulator [Mycobacterium kiyosense]BDE15105.1 TetR family transcriptional regulator [Mycobacterium sp. 20KCMC460]GLB85349.1 TetR family transcriptional regulator [Mycobacterium kiyosense]GLB87633.1 TetR family transcriptional regulator [Mycobacterium kiyosense]GLB94168.1 TetR family transcriptional regulator [Mycobacterium kiyosense]